MDLLDTPEVEEKNKEIESTVEKDEQSHSTPRKMFGEILQGIKKRVWTDSSTEGLEKNRMATLEREIDDLENIFTKNGVDFSRILLDEVMADKKEGKLIEFETFSPYLADYNLTTGEIDKNRLIPMDNIGLKLSKTFREIFPQGRLVSFYDEYNTGMSDSSDPRGIPLPDGKQVILPDQVKEKFRKSIVDLLKEEGAISPDAAEGDTYLMVSESSKQDHAKNLAIKLKEKGLLVGDIEQDGELKFANPDAENPIFREIALRTKNGRWLCEALDASAFLSPENLDITHVVVLPEQFRDQQDKVWEMLRVLGIKPENYHNIFYDENINPEIAISTIKGEFEKAEKLLAA